MTPTDRAELIKTLAEIISNPNTSLKLKNATEVALIAQLGYFKG